MPHVGQARCWLNVSVSRRPRRRRDELDLGHAFGQLQRGLQRVGEPALDAVAPHEAVDDDLDRVLLVPRQPLVALQELGDVDDLAVDPGPHVALAGEILEQGLVLALAAAHHGRQHLEPRALGQQQDAVDDLLRRLALQPGAVVRAVLDTDARVEQAEVVVDLGDRADRRPRVAADADFWSMEIAGDSPSIMSTSGLSICPRNCRA